MKTLKEADKLIKIACDKAIKRKWKLSSITIIDRDKKKCCPLGTLDIHGESSDYIDAARTILGWDHSKANAFALGFDIGPEFDYSDSFAEKKHPRAFALGRKFRKLYKK